MPGYQCDEHGEHGAAVVVSDLHSGTTIALCAPAFTGWAVTWVVTSARQDGIEPQELLIALGEQLGVGLVPATQPAAKSRRGRRGAQAGGVSSDDTAPDGDEGLAVDVDQPGLDGGPAAVPQPADVAVDHGPASGTADGPAD